MTNIASCKGEVSVIFNEVLGTNRIQFSVEDHY